MKIIENIIDQATGFSEALAGKLTKDQALLHQIIYQWRKEQGIDNSKGEYWRKAVNCVLLLGNPTEILPQFQMPPIEYIIEMLKEAKKEKPHTEPVEVESEAKETQDTNQENQQ
jgi:hypothetical protein